MTGLPSNSVLEELLSSHTSDISKHGIIVETQDSAVLSDNLTIRTENIVLEQSVSNNESEHVHRYDAEFTNLIDPELFSETTNNDNTRLTRRFSWPCVYSDDYELNSSALFNNSNNTCAKEKYGTNGKIAPNRFRSIDGMKSFSILRKNTWGSLIYRFRKFCMEHNRNGLVNNSPSSISDLNTSLKAINDLNTKSLENTIKHPKSGVVQYAVFKPINLTMNYDNENLNGFVKNKEDNEDVVAVIKSISNKSITNYGLTRIIRCTTRQEYEVFDHNTGDYFLLKLTNNLNTFNIYKTLFDQPHPNLVEVIQLLTNADFNYTAEPQGKRKPANVYYILLNSCNYTNLSDYHIYTLPSLIDFNILKNIVKGLLNALLYLHSRSLVLSTLTMKSVIICNTRTHGFQEGEKDQLQAKLVDLDDVKPFESKKDIKHDLWLVGNLLFNFVEGKQSKTNHTFRSNLWTLSPKMFDFCNIALGKRSSFNSALEALIHPWFTSTN